MKLSVKSRVKTPYGIGEIQNLRDDGVFVVLMENWKLATGKSPVLYLQADSIERFPLTSYCIGDKVHTTYGKGAVTDIRTEDGVIAVQPQQWLLANAKPPVFYLNAESVWPCSNDSAENAQASLASDPSAIYNGLSVGDKIRTSYGKGTIVELRASDGMIVATPENWLLANGKFPMFYLHPLSVTPCPAEPPASSFESRMQRALDCKDKGNELFKEKDLEGAHTSYGQALTIMNYLGDDLTNEQKAQVFEQTVPCYNNIALCSLKLERFREAAEYANNSVRLVSVLESRIPLSKVWEIMQTRGITLGTLQKKWKRRAFYLQGKGYVGMMELKQAKECFKAALLLIQSDSSLTKEAAELRQLIVTTTKKLEKENKSAKKMWTKAFKKNDGIEGDIERANSPGAAAVSSPSVCSAGTSNKPLSGSGSTSGGVGGGAKAIISGPEDIDVTKYGIGKAAKNSGQSKPSTSALTKKSASEDNMVLGGIFALLTVGLIGGFAFLRYRKW